MAQGIIKRNDLIYILLQLKKYIYWSLKGYYIIFKFERGKKHVGVLYGQQSTAIVATATRHF